MDALAAYESDSDAEDQHFQALNPSTEPLDHDPTDAFGLNGLKETVRPTQHLDPSSPAKDKSRRATNSASAPPLPSQSNKELALAPKVIDNSHAAEALMLRPGDTTMHVNVPYRDMIAPQFGPENPFASNQQRQLGAQQNTLSGHVESVSVSDFDFRNQQRTFDVYGYARDPTLLAGGSSEGASFIGNASAAAAYGGASAMDIRSGQAQFKSATRQLKKQRKGQAGDPGVLEGEGAYLGPWAKWNSDTVTTSEAPSIQADEGMGPTAEEQAAAEALSVQRALDKATAEQTRDKAELEAPTEKQGSEKSVFHGKSMYDYQGRTYMHIPTDVDVNLSGEAGEQECYLPKSCIHTFKGHTKGISTLKLMPNSGHLLLSASLDTTVKLWDLYHEGQCLRTYMGHSKAVRDVAFNNDGRRFLSAGYDRQVKLWDTETGVCLSTFTIAKIPYCVTFHPDPDKQHIFLTGTSDKKVLQYDSNTGEITQEYSQHLGAVNTITFVDQNRRFVTTSDDKVMRGWDYDIPVVIKYVSDPTMHSMPAVTVSPNAKWLACQSMDNQILTFGTDGFKQNRKKVFRGHNVAGFACQPAFSPDGKFLSSGDSEGNLVFWDWKSTKLLKRIRHAHAEPIISHAWLPHESSKLVTGSWDGLIKLWD